MKLTVPLKWVLSNNEIRNAKGLSHLFDNEYDLFCVGFEIGLFYERIRKDGDSFHYDVRKELEPIAKVIVAGFGRAASYHFKENLVTIKVKEVSPA